MNLQKTTELTLKKEYQRPSVTLTQGYNDVIMTSVLGDDNIGSASGWGGFFGNGNGGGTL